MLHGQSASGTRLRSWRADLTQGRALFHTLLVETPGDRGDPESEAEIGRRAYRFPALEGEV
jgi:hypothetical protein